MQVIWLSEFTACEESLMAYQHALPEASPGEMFGGGKTTHAQEMSFGINQLGFTVNHVGNIIFGMHAFGFDYRVYHIL